MRRKGAEGRYTVSGPFEPDHPVPNIGAGMSCAQTLATRHRRVDGEITYYVRDLLDKVCVQVTKLADGAIVTTAV